MIDIRLANIEDAESISFLGKKTFDQSFGYLFKDRKDLTDYFKRTFSVEKISGSISKPHNMYWLVLDGDLPIGYAKLQLNSSSEFIDCKNVCKLQKIYFLKNYVSRGIGGRLQSIIFEKAAEHQQQYLWLSVLKNNEGAINFYKNNDFQIVGEHPFSIGKENFEFWVMSSKLI